MTLKKKFLVIAGAVFICAIGLIYAASRFIFMRGLEEIEEVDVEQGIEQALSALSYLISDLEADTADWAAWDDTYAFIEDRNEEYIESNLGDETFLVLKLHMMLFIDSSGDIVLSKAVDLDTEEEVPVPQDLLAHLSGDSPLLSSPGTQNFVSGIIPLRQGPLLLVSQPILTSEDEGPARGTLIFARYLNSATINELSQVTLLSITMRSISNLAYPDFKEAAASLSDDSPIFIKPLDAQQIGGYTLLKDIYDRPAFILKVEIPRDAYQLGQLATTYYILAVLGVGVLITALTWMFIQKRVLSRVNRLTRDINYITESGDTSIRIPARGSDEVSLVAGTINGMLGALEEAGRGIRESERRYRLLAENVTDVICTLDTDLKLTYVSPSVVNLTGFTPKELSGQQLQKSLDPSIWSAAKDAFTQAADDKNLSRGGSPYSRAQSYEFESKKKDGSAIWLEARIAALQDADGRTAGFVGIIRDITERRKAAEELQLRYEEEKALRQQLEEEIRKRVEFTRALVHELKTPITPVLAAIELLQDEVKGERPERLVNSISRSAVNLNQRIDELLDLAKGETDMLQLNLVTVDMATMLQEIAGEMTPVALANEQIMTVDIPASLPAVLADRERLRQVVMNLLNNAFKFTPAGGKITLKAGADNDNLTVEIQDTGRGISREDRKRLFEPYFRRIGDRERLSGLGLGLALAKKFVELHGGEIWVKGRKGKGSTFGFSLPVAAPGSEAEQANPEGES